MDKKNVLIIDNSAVMRKFLNEILSAEKKINIIGTALDEVIAAHKIKNLNPDIITIDIDTVKFDYLFSSSFLSSSSFIPKQCCGPGNSPLSTSSLN